MNELRVLAVIPAAESGTTFIFAHRQVRQLRTLGISVEVFALQQRTNALGLLREARRFREHVRRYRPHVVHSHYGTVTALFCALVSRLPLVITFRGTDLNPSSEYSQVRGCVSRWMSHFAALFARQVICVSPELRERLWWRRSAIHVIPTGVDTEEFYPIPRDVARDTLGWDSSDRVILFNHGASRAPNKRRDIVEAAVVKMSAEMSNVRLVAMEGDVPGEIVPLYVNAADAVVLTSDFEGSPTIVQEALACEVPVCAVDVGDTRAMLEGVEACAIAARTPEAIADALISLVGVPRRSNARRFAHRYSAQVLFPRVLAVLRRAQDPTAASADVASDANTETR